jgi:hypothetical protein
MSEDRLLVALEALCDRYLVEVEEFTEESGTLKAAQFNPQCGTCPLEKTENKEITSMTSHFADVDVKTQQA